MNERTVLSAVMSKLRFHPDVLWYSRLQSGRMGGYTLNPAGTPDVMAVVNQYNGSIAMLFIEIKRPGKTTLDYEQKRFVQKMAGKPKTMCVVVNDPKQINMYIKQAKDL